MLDALNESNQVPLHNQKTELPQNYHALQAAITEIIAESKELDQAIILLIQSICLHTHWDFGEIWNIDVGENHLVKQAQWHMVHYPKFEEISRQITFSPGIGLPGRVWITVHPLWIPDVVEDINFLRASFAARAGLHGGVGIPLYTHEKVVGVMTFFSQDVRHPDSELLTLFEMIGRHIGLFIERQKFQLSEYERIRQEATRQERLRITRVLQSSTMQNLFSVAVTAEILPYLWESNQTKLWYGLNDLRHLTEKTLMGSQKLLSELQSEAISELGVAQFLDPLLANCRQKMHGELSMTMRCESQLPINGQVAIYCVVQEALQNIIQHAFATRVKFDLNIDQGVNTLFISDNGKGFDPNNVLPDRLGLKIMRGCAESIAGKLDIVTVASQGTQILLSWRNIR